MIEVQRFNRRYIVEVGAPQYWENLSVTGIHWTFSRAFETREDADAYAERYAEDHEYTRVMDRGEDFDY